MTAFLVGGVSLAAGIGTASAESSEQVPKVVSTCLLPLLPCDEPSGGNSGDSWSEAPAPQDSWSNAPVPHDSWSQAPVPQDSWSNAPAPQDSWSSGPAEPEQPWRPADEEQHKVPKGHPETGGGGLQPGNPVWPFAVGGVALLTGAGLTGYAARRRKTSV
ncbi:hypothetical protein HII36_01305 [Nonomuraea sp. NN258]|uniref:hypothetical protein n=1 Tax=Nonomuraea antri TaxID=2730852 RepID=UPI0015695E80|nr:hypothetical protein [Nonomuraea antri]NRQ30482.1 hypothetical protein [Nonomuraea antri]